MARSAALVASPIALFSVLLALYCHLPPMSSSSHPPSRPSKRLPSHRRRGGGGDRGGEQATAARRRDHPRHFPSPVRHASPSSLPAEDETVSSSYSSSPRTPPSGVSYLPPKRRPRPSPAASARSSDDAPESISILTWNVWFGPLRQSDRYAAIVREVLDGDVDVACFQEVTSPFVSALRASPEITAGYDLSPNVIPHHSYGCLTVARKTLGVGFEEVGLPGRMGRTLIVAWTPFDLAVGNVHLESLDNEGTRREQLVSANAALGGGGGGGGRGDGSGHRGGDSSAPFDAVLCGDFNFDSRQTWGDWRRKEPARRSGRLENNVLAEAMPGWVDAWPALHGAEGDPGITFDGETNPVCVRDRRERMRYDRVMVRNGTAARRPGDDEHDGGEVSLAAAAAAAATVESTGGTVLENIAMVGTDTLDETGLKPSDHYGLIVRLKPGRRRMGGSRRGHGMAATAGDEK